MPLRDGLRIGGMAMIISLLLVNVIETFDQVALQVLAPDIQNSLDVSKTTLQGLTSLGGVVLVVATLPFAWLADRYVRTRDPRRRHCGLGRVHDAHRRRRGTVADGIRPRGRGFGASARIPISPSLIADKYPIGVRTRMFAFENLGRPLGLVLGPFIVGAVAAQSTGEDGWRWAMVAIAIPAVFVAIAPDVPPRAGTRLQRARGGPRPHARRRQRAPGAAQFRRRTAQEGADVPVPHPRHRHARVRARERARAAELPVRRVVRLLRVQARLGPVAHVRPRAARDPDRRPVRRPTVPPRPPLGGTPLRLARHRLRRLHHDRHAARAPSSRSFSSSRLPNACQLAAFTQIGPTISAVVPYRMRAPGVRAHRLLHLPARWVLRRTRGRGGRRRVRRAHRDPRGGAVRGARRRPARVVAARAS